MEQEPVKKRGRKKKCVIDSIAKLRANDNSEKVLFTSSKPTSENKENMEVTQISFGALNVILESSKKTDKNDLRKNFDERFMLSTDEKVPNVLSQEIGDKVVYEILMEETPASSKIKNELTNIKTVKKLYKVLDSLEEWPEKSDLLCHWCCHSFDSMPIPCPISYNRVKDQFGTRGIFCSWPCVLSYSTHHFKSLSYVYLFLMKLYGEVPEITMAPDKIVLKSFGGKMTIDEFRNFGMKPNHSIKISTDLISYENQEILETYNELKK